MVDTFVRLLASQFNIHSVGVNTILDYFSYAFAYWSTKSTKRRISLGWIIGKKTFQRWVEKSEGTDFYTDRFLKEYSIDLDLLRQEIYEEQVEEKQDLDQAEEIEKLRFTGQARLFHCLQYTTLYNHRSLTCLGCSTRSACKQLLKKNMIQIYYRRGYANNESI